jgi:HD-GYP domain-containing protein (c-di-GMP phosphodiesterase class II)
MIRADSGDVSLVPPLPKPRTTAPWLAGALTFALLGLVGGLLGVVVRPPAFVILALAAVTLGGGIRAFALLRASRQVRSTEISLTATALVALSVAAVTGLTVASGLLRAAAVAQLGVLVGFLLAACFALPLTFATTTFARRRAREWRTWVGGVFSVAALGVVGLAVAAVARPAVFAVQLGYAVRVPFVVVGVFTAFRLTLRLWRLREVGHGNGVEGASYGWLLLALAAVCFVDGKLFSMAWWAGHALLVGGVLVVAQSLRALVGSMPNLEVFEPVLSRDPLYALDLAAAPLVVSFCAEIATQSAIDREHVRRVAELAVRAGEVAGLHGVRLRNLGIASVLHDVGKHVVPVHILSKATRLHPDEFREVQKHAAEGERMLKEHPSLHGAAPIVRWHHERVDGRGYPDQLTGDSIPMEAMIVSVCDAFDAMVSDRSYRRALGPARALDVLGENAGTQWDPRAVDALKSVVKRGRLPQSANAADPVVEPIGRPMPYRYLDGLPNHIGESIAPRNPVADSLADLMRR